MLFATVLLIVIPIIKQNQVKFFPTSAFASFRFQELQNSFVSVHREAIDMGVN